KFLWQVRQKLGGRDNADRGGGSMRFRVHPDTAPSERPRRAWSAGLRPGIWGGAPRMAPGRRPALQGQCRDAHSDSAVEPLYSTLVPTAAKLRGDSRRESIMSQAEKLLRELIAFPSVNPAFVPA